VERVWSLVAAPGFLVAAATSVAGTVASDGASLVAKNPNLGEVSVRVEMVEPPTYVAYRWASAFPGQELREDNRALVEFTLSPEGGKTRLQVSGVRRAPEARRTIFGVTDECRGAAEPVNNVLVALADPTRRHLLDVLAAQGEATATTLAKQLPVSRQAVVKHLAVLDTAGLVSGRRVGREVRYAVRPAALHATARWMAALVADWDRPLANIKRVAEAAEWDSR
jgi:DNA-binding transcriptional ArsR family regulator